MPSSEPTSCQWNIYREALARYHHGDALWQPGPIYSYKRVRIGDVGYIRKGRFHLLFSAGIPLGLRTLGIDVPHTFEPLDVGPIIQGDVRPPGYLRTDEVTEIGGTVGGSAAVACPVEPGGKITFELSHKQGAALITRYPVYSEGAERIGAFKRYAKTHYNSWVDFALENDHGEDVKPVLVDGVHLTQEFAMFAYSGKRTRIRCEFSVDVPAVASASVSLWGSWHTQGLVHTNCGPHPITTRGNRSLNESPAPESVIPDECNQCVFISYYRVEKMLGFPRVIKAGAGPHQLPRGDPGHDNTGDMAIVESSGSDSTEVDYPEIGSSLDVIHNVPLDGRDGFDVVAEFIFQRSNATSILLHHRDIQGLLQVDEEETIRFLEESRVVERVEIDENGVGQLIPVSRVESSRPDLLEDDSDITGDTPVRTRSTQILPETPTVSVFTNRSKEQRFTEDTKILPDIAKESADWFSSLKSALGGVNVLIKPYEESKDIEEKIKALKPQVDRFKKAITTTSVDGDPEEKRRRTELTSALDEIERRSRELLAESTTAQFVEKAGDSGEAVRLVERLGEAITRYQQATYNQIANPTVVEKPRHAPYVDPHAQAEKQRRVAEAEANQIPISGIEFGWECRDTVFSCEWEKRLDPPGTLGYDEDQREFRAVLGSKSVVLRSAQVNWASCGMDGSLPVICFSLESHPIFEETPPQPDLADAFLEIFDGATLQPDLARAFAELFQPSTSTRTRISSLDPDHERIVAYASLAVRFTCTSPRSLEMFRTLSRISPLGALADGIYHKEYRRLFSAELEARLESWLKQLDFEVAFQVEKIVRDAKADFREILTLREAVEDLVRLKGMKHAVGVLRSFDSALKETPWDAHPNYILDLFLTIAEEYVPEIKSLADMASEDTFTCYHVSVTPTAMKFNGPFQDRSNRVFRRYPDHHSCFIRVAFEEETRLQLRFDREVDGAAFVKKRYGTILRETGLKICGRMYRFLAYSQSALKDHSVWFMRPFRDQDGELVDPAFIIDSLGDFDDAPDLNLVRCPGRYGARISQAFTSTDSGVSIEPEEIREASDVEVYKVRGDPSFGEWNFTDGVGTISIELAKQIWDTMRARRRSARKVRFYPKCFQIRFQGCKGMVSVDYRQSGRELVLRPSMIKFRAPEWSEIEIARAFDRPSPFYLNRPLIMVLEHLGVPYGVFKEYQDGAVRDAEDSRQDFERAGRLLESFGLGASFHLPSVLYHLHKLGVPMQRDPFYKHLLDFAINHVLRELKHHARIPVPGHTLVGVADVHGWLRPDEVFACFVNQQTKKLEYLEGDMVITRSPVIHPGDVQLVKAIGKPPPGSPFEKEPLPNAVVFSIKGDRPVPSKTGGGDLDGDVYNVASLRSLPIRNTHPAAAYTDAPKRLLDRRCTMDDVADFVTDYINSDVLGLVAINWLIIADQSDKSVLDEDCMILAQLHSDAVDYPKSSTPVPLQKIPRLKFKEKPDWNQPETMNDSKSADYYPSQRAIGRLFRAIELPALDIVQRVNKTQRKKLREEEGEEEGDRLVTQLGRMRLRDDDQVDVAVYGRITDFIDVTDVDPDHRVSAFTLFDRYTAELKAICAAHTISYRRDAMLTEEEATVGTIVARTSQPRYRRDMISKLREQTNLQVKGVRNELVSEEDGFEAKLHKAWALWRVTQEERELMGARSLGLVALGIIFDTIREFEEELKANN